MANITISVSENVWRYLNLQKFRGESFQQALDRILLKNSPEIKTAYELEHE